MIFPIQTHIQLKIKNKRITFCYIIIKIICFIFALTQITDQRRIFRNEISFGNSIQFLQFQENQFNNTYEYTIYDQYDFRHILNKGKFVYIPLKRNIKVDLKKQRCPTKKNCVKLSDCNKKSDEICINNQCQLRKWCNLKNQEIIQDFGQYLSRYKILIKSQIHFQQNDKHFDNFFIPNMNTDQSSPYKSIYTFDQILKKNQNLYKSNILEKGGILNVYLTYICYFVESLCYPELNVKRVDGIQKPQGYQQNHTKYNTIDNQEYKDIYQDTGIKLNFIVNGEYFYFSLQAFFLNISMIFGLLAFPHYLSEFLIFIFINNFRFLKNQKFVTNDGFSNTVLTQEQNISSDGSSSGESNVDLNYISDDQKLLQSQQDSNENQDEDQNDSFMQEKSQENSQNQQSSKQNSQIDESQLNNETIQQEQSNLQSEDDKNISISKDQKENKDQE